MTNMIFTFKASNEDTIISIDSEDKDKVFSHTENWVICRNEYNVMTTIIGWSSILKKSVTLSRVIMNCNDPLLEVDHINRNKPVNVKSNLRICTPSQNSINRKRNKFFNSSKYRGVSFHKLRSKYQANIRVNKKLLFLGFFKLEVDAAIAYNNAAKIYHGEFAIFNKI